MQVQIHQIYVSPGHNYFGHHGQPAGENPIVPVDRVTCRAGRGLEGDRFFDYKPDYKGQVTFFAWEVYEAIKRELNVPELSAGAFRRNVLVSGMDLAALIGRTFRLGGVDFEGTAEAKPCYWMEQAVAPGAEAWLRGQGGLRAKILSDGVLVPGPVRCAVLEPRLNPAAAG
ncbi:MAG: MOSC domain-containing protein [Opitutaceae bacterium]|nr:MOSC domain-containing protein [Opitutaceae bacterium]